MPLHGLGNCELSAAATTFAVASVALLFIVAAAVDVSRWCAERATIQAIHAGSVQQEAETGQIDKSYADNFFRAGLQNSAAANSIEALTCSTKNSSLTCSASGKIPMMRVIALTRLAKPPAR